MKNIKFEDLEYVIPRTQKVFVYVHQQFDDETPIIQKDLFWDFGSYRWSDVVEYCGFRHFGNRTVLDMYVECDKLYIRLDNED